MRKKGILLLFCTAVVTFNSVFNALAWELVDRDGDGTAESILFCNGEYDDADNYLGRSIQTWELVLSESAISHLDWHDRMCKNDPEYIKKRNQWKEQFEMAQKKGPENQKAIDAKLDEIAKQCINDSMSLIEKIQSVIGYFKMNYPMDENAVSFSTAANGVPYANNEQEMQFLNKTYVFNEREYNAIVWKIAMEDFFGYNDGGDWRSLVKYYGISKEDTYRFYCYQFLGGWRLYFIDGRVYERVENGLELREGMEGMSEGAKQSLISTFQRDRNSGDPDSSPVTRDIDNKWIPEEFRQFYCLYTGVKTLAF